MVFFDTNVLVYVHDQRSAYKRDVARRLYAAHLYGGSIALSTQVLQEFFVTITRKAQQISVREARNLVSHLAGLNVVSIEPAHVVSAIDLHARHQLSFWDSLIIIAAKSAGAQMVLSEDLGHGQTYDGVRVENPFLTQ
jgi:predicted nucleic acid-binding protein